MKVKILLVSSNPDRDLALDDEYREILTVIKGSDIEVRQNPASRIEDFIESLNAYKPDIIHFTGHGSDNGELVFTNDDGSDALSKELLKKLLKVTNDNVKLFFLDACYSKIQAEVISSEIDYVIGMNRAVSENTATKFASTFYQFFASGASLKESFEQAKIVLAKRFPAEADIPELLLREEDVPTVNLTTITKPTQVESVKLRTEELKNIVKKLNYSDKELYKLAYSVRPKELNGVFTGLVDEVIDSLSSMRDVGNTLNIPIICFAMKVYNHTANTDILEWIDCAKKSYLQLSNCEPLCIENKIDTAHHIIIDINASKDEPLISEIVVYEDRNGIESKIDYQNVLTEKVNLQSDEDIKRFMDILYQYLDKFSDWDKIVLEFVLPEKLLNQKIHLWENIEGYKLSEDFKVVYRLRERFDNYSFYSQYWDSKWNEYYDSREKNIGSIYKVLDSKKEITKIRSSVPSIIMTKFSIFETDIFKRIYKYGIPIIISPSQLLNGSELTKYNEWFEDEFKEVKIDNLVTKIQDLCLDYIDEFQSEIILIWDNPNNIPLSKKNPKENQLGTNN